MYEERKDKFSVRDLIMQILFIALLVFLLMWIFPTKGDFKNLSSKQETKEEDNSILYDRIFNENILAMKDAAKSYYTTPRLPQNIGDKVSMTLGEMLDKKIILPFKDKKGKSCDTTASYVEITKPSNDEFIMKVNLKCSEEENYLLVYMGCYDYCSTAICEKNKEDITTPIIKPTNPTNNSSTNNNTNNSTTNNTTNNNNQNITYIINNITNNIIINVCPECCPEPKPEPTPTPTPTPNPSEKPEPTPEPDKEYECEYIKVTNAKFGSWGEWTEWSRKIQYPTQLKQVKSKTQRTTVTKKVLTGYNVRTYKDPNKPIYKQVQVQSGTETKKVCASYGTKQVPSGTVVYGEWVNQGIVKLYTIPSNTNTVRYDYISAGVDNCENCSYKNFYIYRKYTRTSSQGTNTVTYCTSYKTESVPLYKTQNVLVGYGTSEERTPVYDTIRDVEDVKYYSYRTRKITSGKKDVKWDICEGSTLVNSGYEKTGNKREK